MTENSDNARRDVKARGTRWAKSIAAGLSKTGIRPNTISLLSIVFAAIAGTLLIFSGKTTFPGNSIFLVAAAVFIQIRLLCNLFDGMVAVEGGKSSPSGLLFNDFPDRIADPLIFVCAGYAAQNIPYAVEIGWLTGLLSVFTAYVRTLAGASGAKQLFLGPMAKQHRLALITIAILACAAAGKWEHRGLILMAILVIISLGCVITAVRRLIKAIRELEEK
jgi:phosphatidylglycerophosphate synthase